MADYCSNIVMLDGPEKNIRNLMKALEKTNEAREFDKTLQFILFTERYTSNYMCDICIDNKEEGEFRFESRYVPEMIQPIVIANMFHVSFEMHVELIPYYYGTYQYNCKTKELYYKKLSIEEIEDCKRCQNEDCKSTCGKGDFNRDDCDLSEDYEIMDELLDKKEFELEFYKIEPNENSVTDSFQFL